jgi:hypothetical protein
MLRKLIFTAIGLIIAIVVLLVLGLSTNSAGLLALSTLCLAPALCFVLGALFGRGSVEYQLVPNKRIVQATSAQGRRFAGRTADGEVLG